MDGVNMKFLRTYNRGGRLIRINMTSCRDQCYALYVSNCALTDLAGTKSMHEKGVVDTGKSNYAEEKARVYGSAFIVTSNDMLKPCEWIIWLCDGFFHGSCSGCKLTGWFAIYIVILSGNQVWIVAFPVGFQQQQVFAVKEKRTYKELIQAIEKVYVMVSLAVLQKRMEGYHKLAQQGMKAYISDIKSPLLGCIDEIIQHHQGAPEILKNIDNSILDLATTHLHPHVKDTSSPHIVDRENVGELSRYFKARSYGSDLHPGIEDRLEHSTWEHIHAALRYARQNNKQSAKVHADIANSACKELTHYMSEDRYLTFLKQIQKQLDTLRSASTK